MKNLKALNIGCGPPEKWIPGVDGMDIINFGQKYIGDILSIIFTEKYDFIYLHHIVEHIQDTVALFNKLCDILYTGGLVDIRVPVVPFIHAFVDPTHVKFIPGPDFFRYFTKDSLAGRCYSKGLFEIVKHEKDRFEWEMHIVMRLKKLIV